MKGAFGKKVYLLRRKYFLYLFFRKVLHIKRFVYICQTNAQTNNTVMATLHFEFEKYDLTFELEVKYTLNIVSSIGTTSNVTIGIACEAFICNRAYDGADNNLQEAEINDVFQRDSFEIARKAHRLILEKVEI